MKKTGIWLCVLISIMLVVSGCAAEKKQVSQTTTYGPNVQSTNPGSPGTITVHEETIVDEDENVGPTTPDWANQVETAEGMSAIRVDKPRGQAIAMAQRGAKLDALRNLMEKVGGLKISSKTIVKDMVTEWDQIDAQSAAFMRGAKVVGKNLDEAQGIYTVKVEMPLYDVWEYLKTERLIED